MGRVFNQAPLPFMGQKRRFVREFKTALKQFDDKAVYVDLFGGSGLLSHIVRHEKPKASVIYNDFDDYHKRIRNIDRTNKLIQKFRIITADLPKDKQIKEPYRTEILELISQESQTGYVDYISLSSSLLFSMNYATTFDELLK
jgi:adenine-specific DNA methylase